jgi:thiol-disulfide isomerase/thioredoxin
MKPLRFLFALSLALISRVALFAAPAEIKGTVELPQAVSPSTIEVSLSSISAMSPAKTVVKGIDGKFVLPAVQAGLYKLWVMSPGMLAAELPVVVVDKDKTMRVAVRLTAYPYLAEFNQVEFLSKQLDGGKPTAMTKKPDGTFEIELTAAADTVAYQLTKITSDGRTLNGTQSDYFVSDGGGDFYSVIRTTKGQPVKIVFDPKKIVRLENPAGSVWDKEHAYLGTINELATRSEAAERKATKEYLTAQARGESMAGFKFNFGTLPAELKGIVGNTKNPLPLRQYAMLVKLGLDAYTKLENSEPTKGVLELIPVTSPMWALGASRVTRAFKTLPESEPTLREMVEKNPDRSVQAGALIVLCRSAKQKNDLEAQQSIYDKLKTNYSDLREVKIAMMQLNPNEEVAVGKPVPEFSVELLGEKKTVSRSSMLGKYYLIDFWAVWCGPCVAELPKLHVVYEKYKGKKGFEVLSLSFDNKKEDIEKFRAEKFKMPWQHTFIEGGFNAPLSKSFEVLGIPKPILVDDKGMIVAMSPDLRGEALEKTLEKFLAEKSN